MLSCKSPKREKGGCGKRWSTTAASLKYNILYQQAILSGREIRRETRVEHWQKGDSVGWFC